MDKLLEIGDGFDLGGSKFNPTLLIPVLVVVVGAAAVFVLGFKRTNGPKFRSNPKLNNCSGNVSLKRKKRAQTEQSVGVALSFPKEAQAVNGKVVKHQLLQHGKTEKTTKKTTTPIKSVSTSKASGRNNDSSKKKFVVSFDNTNNNGEGEWTTVITKKQKKQVLADTLMQVVASNGISNKSSPSSISTNKKKRNSKSAVAATVEIVPAVEIIDVNIKNGLNVHGFELSNVAKSTTHVVPEVIVTQETTLHQIVTAVSAFKGEILELDKSGGADWVENKQQKKNKRRALKE